MKNLITFLITTLLLSTAQAQYARINNDSILAKSELILENSSKSKTGAFLQNKSNGRTEFAFAIDSVFLRNDTLFSHRGDGWRASKLPTVTSGGSVAVTQNGDTVTIGSTKLLIAPNVRYGTWAQLNAIAFPDSSTIYVCTDRPLTFVYDPLNDGVANLGTRMSNNLVSVKTTGHYNAEWWGAKNDGTTDNASAVNNAIQAVHNEGGGIIDVSAGVVSSLGRINLLDGVYLQGAGIGATTLDLTGATVSSYNIGAEGTLTNLPSLSASLMKGDTIMTFSAPHGLKVGDLINLHDTIQFSFSPARSYYKRGEFFTVKAVLSDTQVVLGSNSFDSYLLGSNILIYKVNPVRTGISGMTIKFKKGNLVKGVDISLGVDCNFSDLYLTGNQNANIYADRCYNMTFDRVHAFDNNDAVGYNYGLAIANCQKIRVTNSTFETTRHGLTIGGQDYYGTVPNREIDIDGVYANSFSTEPGLDTHGNCEYVTIHNSFLPSGVVLSGNHNTLENNTYIGNQNTGGEAIAFTEQTGSDFTVKNNDLFAQQNFLYLVREAYSAVTIKGGGIFDFSHNHLHVDTFHHPSYPSQPTNIVYITTVDTAGTEDIRMHLVDNEIISKDTVAGQVNGILINPLKLRGFNEVTLADNRLFGCGITIYNNIKEQLSVKNNRVIRSPWYGIAYFDYITPIVDSSQKTAFFDDNTVAWANRTGVYLNQQFMGKKYSNIHVRRNTSINNGRQSSQSEFSFWALGAKNLTMLENTFGEDSTTALNANTYRLDSIANLVDYVYTNVGNGYNSKTALYASVDNERSINEHGNLKVSWGTAAPTTGTHGQGDIRKNTSGVRGDPVGWYCTAAGTPGTWDQFGTIGGNSGLIYKTTIPSGADLNTYQTSGIYEQTSTASAAAGTNYPVAVAGELRVFQNHPDFTYQEYHAFNDNGFYYRSRYQTTWSTWRRDMNTSDSTLYSTKANVAKARDSVQANLTAHINNTSNPHNVTTSQIGAEPTIAAPNTTGKYWNGYKQFVSLNTDSITQGTIKFMAIGNTVASGTAKSIPFIGTNGLLQQSNSNLNYDSLINTLNTPKINSTGQINIPTGQPYRWQNGNAEINNSTYDILFKNYDGSALTEHFRISSVGKLIIPATMTATGTTGAQTINKASGSVNFAAGATSIGVTNSLVTTSSIVMPVVQTNDANSFTVRVVPAAGSFTIYLSAAPAAETKVGFFVIN